jgi:hypothetical protein
MLGWRNFLPVMTDVGPSAPDWSTRQGLLASIAVLLAEPSVFQRTSIMECSGLSPKKLRSMAKMKLRHFSCGAGLACSNSENIGVGTSYTPSLLQLLSISLTQSKERRRETGQRRSRILCASTDSLTPVKEKCRKSRCRQSGIATTPSPACRGRRGKEVATSELVQPFKDGKISTSSRSRR